MLLERLRVAVAELLIENVTCVTLDDERRVLPGAIEVRDGRISKHRCRMFVSGAPETVLESPGPISDLQASVHEWSLPKHREQQPLVRLMAATATAGQNTNGR